MDDRQPQPGRQQPGWLIRFREAAADRFHAVFERLDRASGGRLAVLRSAYQSYSQARASEAAASIAYYALFSLFPLLLFLLAGLTYVLEQDTARRQLLAYIDILLPVSQSIIIAYLDRVLEQSPSVGLIALAGLLWSASGVFNTLALNINRAWSEGNVRTFLQARLVAIVMVAVLVGLLFLSLLVSAGLDLLARFQLPIGNSLLVYESLLFVALANLLPFLSRLAMLWGMFRWVPTTAVPARAAFAGALVSTLLWELITRAFVLYLGSPLARFESIYGSLGTLIILMLWIYLAGSIVLFGAHLTACMTKSSPSNLLPAGHPGVNEIVTNIRAK